MENPVRGNGEERKLRDLNNNKEIRINSNSNGGSENIVRSEKDKE